MIGRDLLPGRCMVDTGVVIRALGHRPEDPRARACQEFWQAMLKHRRTMLIAAPTYAEVELGILQGHARMPVDRYVPVVPFDDEAARVCAKHFPLDMMKAHAQGRKMLQYYKYDALIAACAIRHRADCIVALDDALSDMCRNVVKVMRPTDFEDPSLPLFPPAMVTGRLPSTPAEPG